MSRTEVTLIHGVKVGDEMQLIATLREPTAGDVIDATVESEKLLFTPAGYQLIASPTLVGANVLRRQIVSIGVLQGPLDLDQIKRLHPEDLNILQDAAERLEQAASQAVTQRGRSDNAGSATGASDGHPQRQD